MENSTHSCYSHSLFVPDGKKKILQSPLYDDQLHSLDSLVWNKAPWQALSLFIPSAPYLCETVDVCYLLGGRRVFSFLMHSQMLFILFCHIIILLCYNVSLLPFKDSCMPSLSLMQSTSQIYITHLILLSFSPAYHPPLSKYHYHLTTYCSACPAKSLTISVLTSSYLILPTIVM